MRNSLSALAVAACVALVGCDNDDRRNFITNPDGVANICMEDPCQLGCERFGYVCNCDEPECDQSDP